MKPRLPHQLLEHALATSRSDHCVVLVQSSTEANLRWANNTLTTNGVMSSVDVTVIAFQGAGNAALSGTSATLEQVTALVEAADAAAATAVPAEDRADLVAGDAAPGWDAEPEDTSIAIFDQFATSLGESFAEAEAEDRILYGFVSHAITTTYLGSSTGLRLRHVQPTGHYGCTAKTADLSTSAWTGAATRDFSDVDAVAMATTLKTRLGWGARRVDLPAGRYDTVLPATAVSDLMIDAYWNAGARVAHEGQSVFSAAGGGTRLGERVVAPGVRLHSDPAYPGLECMPYVVAPYSSSEASVYDNGLALSATDWINDGVLSALLQTRQTAQLTRASTTPEIDNLVLSIDGGRGTVEDLVGGVEDGLLLTCLWYIREVDPQTLLLTGLTRDGVYRIEGGEITGAVNNFRFNESPIDLLRRFSAASETTPSFSREWGDDYFSRTATPSLRIPDFNMSSVSQAL